ncbi:MAG: hypothetical protein K2M56_07980 [Muribaculaceae bacterium]|nr:hypothetical protein [Muribaculaceae bacterium]
MSYKAIPLQRRAFAGGFYVFANVRVHSLYKDIFIIATTRAEGTFLHWIPLARLVEG